MIIQFIKENNIIDVMEVGAIHYDEAKGIILHPMQDRDALHIILNNQHILSSFEFIIDPEDTPSFKVLN